MPRFIFTLALIFVSQTLFGQTSDSSKLEYRGGRVYYKGEILKKPSEMERVFAQKHDSSMSAHFKKYQTNQGVANVFAYIGGGLMGYTAGSYLGGGKFNTPLFLSGVGGVGVAFLFDSFGKKHLKESISRYNYAGSSSGFRFEPSRNGIGIIARF